MEHARPLSDRWSVSFAGLLLVALAAGSFTSGLLKQMNVPAPDNSAQVVVMAPKQLAPSASIVLAQTLRPAAPPAAEAERPRRRAAARPLEAPQPEPEAGMAQNAADLSTDASAVDAAAPTPPPGLDPAPTLSDPAVP